MRRARNEKGQMTIEAILIMTILTAVSIALSRYFQSQGLLAELIEGPWKPVQGMIENGVWASGDKAKAQHPSHFSRHSSAQGQDITGK